VPEDGKDDQRDQRKRGNVVNACSGIEAEQPVGAVDLEAGDHHDDDQERLRPMPEALVLVVDVDPFHGYSSSGVSSRRCAETTRSPP
jgi:hypothetical protein